MKMYLRKINKSVFLIIIFCLFLFFPGILNYFHQDDFIHLYHSQTFEQLISAFNIFQKGEFPFYRPIPTQLYFYFGQKLFGLNPIPYHLVNFLIYSFNIVLVFKLIRLITGSRNIALVALIFYAINSTHFAPLYSPAYVHELFYAMFGLLTVIKFLNWSKKRRISDYVLSNLFFIMALMTKETAVILPGILALIYLYKSKKKKLWILIKIFFSFVLVLTIYLLAHFYLYGIAQSPSYQIIIGKKSLNILVWYLLWALSTPNILIDFVGPGLRFNPIFFQVAGLYGFIFTILVTVFLTVGFLILLKIASVVRVRSLMEEIKWFIFGLTWFVLGMIPLIVFPLHKLATEQAFSLVGLSLSLSIIVNSGLSLKRGGKILSILFLGIYLLMAINTIFLANGTHWIVRSSYQAGRVLRFIKENYPYLPDNAVIYFKNGLVKIPQYGSSRQIHTALGNGVGLKLVLQKPDLKYYFEDINPQPQVLDDKNTIILQASDFLGY